MIYTDSILDSYTFVYHSQPEKKPRLFLIGEYHNSDECKRLNARLIEENIAPGSCLISEGSPFLKPLTKKREASIISDLRLKENVTDSITMQIGWDTGDANIYEDRTSAYLWSKMIVGDSIFSLFLSLKQTLDMTLKLVKEPQSQPFAHMFYLLAATKIQEAWKIYQNDIFPYESKVKPICDMHGLGVWQPFPEELVTFLQSIPNTENLQSSFLSCLRKTETIIHTIYEERSALNRAIELEIPQRTDAMCKTVQTVAELIEQGAIKGNVFLIAGKAHLCEDPLINDPLYSLRSLYNTLDGLQIPTIVLYPSILD